ncbi:HNH endonuclease [Caballeronia sp. AZ1_KS37]|uniref:HNH endonuclease n=1 Tax=Caballeronia sp. AZ1_KS37 TaxID=2921756 RepID=UPI002027DF5E|nr:HNH endonuclease [Caballeronia sp. AZ1_KS37]
MKVQNTYEHQQDGTTTLSITKVDGSIYHCFIDTADFERVSKHVWTVSSTGYATRGFRENGKFGRINMHRFLMTDVPDGRVVDHIDTDRLNNRRSNLRIATLSENQHNRRLNSNKTVPVKGVCTSESRKNRNVHARIECKGVVRQRSWSVSKYGEDQAVELATAWIQIQREQLHADFARHH